MFGKRKGGLKDAIEMLSGLPLSERNNLLEIIAQKDPTTAELLKANLVSLEDIRFLTTGMLQELLREISLDDLALALRISTGELKSFIFSNISSTMKKDIEEILLGPPVPVNKVQEATDKILEVMRRKVDRGELVIDKSGTDPYV